MGNVYAKCPVHGIFKSHAISFTNSTDVKLDGNYESCPTCGSLSPILDGTFNFDNNGIPELVAGPAFTYEVYKQFKKLVEVAKKEELDVDEIIKRTEEISPELATSLNQFIQRSGISTTDRNSNISNLIAFLSLLMTAWQIFQADKKDEKPTAAPVTNNYYTDSKIEQFRRNPLGFYPKQKNEVKPARTPTELPVKPKSVKKKKRKKNVTKAEVIEEIIIEEKDSTRRIIYRIIKRQ